MDESLICESERNRRALSPGFSLIEVLVCVALISVSLTGVLHVMRQQVHSTAALRSHAEARVILEEAANRFQYGLDFEEESVVRGLHGIYTVRLGVETQPGGADEEPSDSPLESYRVTVSWNEGGREKTLALGVWRYSPEVSEGEQDGDVSRS